METGKSDVFERLTGLEELDNFPSKISKFVTPHHYPENFFSTWDYTAFGYSVGFEQLPLRIGLPAGT